MFIQEYEKIIKSLTVSECQVENMLIYCHIPFTIFKNFLMTIQSQACVRSNENSHPSLMHMSLPFGIVYRLTEV